MKKGFKTIIIFIVAFTLIFSVIYISNSFNIIESGQVYTNENDNKTYSLSDYSWDSDLKNYYFEIVVNDINKPISLVYGRLSSDIMVNGKIITESFKYSKFSSVIIDSEWFDGDTNTLRMDFKSNLTPHNDPIYLTTVTGAKKALALYYMAFAFGLGITFLMTVYGLSLYYRKSSEKYLLWFSIYTGSLTIWSLCSLLLEMNWYFVKPLNFYAYGCSVLFNIAFCFIMFNINIPGYFKNLKKSEILSLIGIWFVLETIIPVSYKNVFYFFLYFLSFAILIYASFRRFYGAWLLLMGHTVSQGFRLILAISTLDLLPVTYVLKVMQYSKLFNLPFAFCCMFLINNIFAEKFSESEALSIQLEQVNQSLEKKVAERTHELNEHLKQRNNFNMNIFHDLRTPLFVLQGYLERIYEDPQISVQIFPMVKERLDFIQHLIEDLFLMSKLEDKQVILETERVHLSKVVEKVVNACQITSDNKNILMEYKIDKDCITWGDEFRLEQAFQNLVINAIYYTKPGGSVSVELHSFNNTAYITITDTGVGISHEDLNKIFNRYYQISGVKKHQSTGIGLTIANEIIKQHGGTITVDSEIGKGTKFTVKLPLVQS